MRLGLPPMVSSFPKTFTKFPPQTWTRSPRLIRLSSDANVDYLFVTLANFLRETVKCGGPPFKTGDARLPGLPAFRVWDRVRGGTFPFSRQAWLRSCSG